MFTCEGWISGTCKNRIQELNEAKTTIAVFYPPENWSITISKLPA